MPTSPTISCSARWGCSLEARHLDARTAGQEGPMARTEKRGIVWQQMAELEKQRLGRREIVSDERDKFVLDPAHPAAARLTSRPNSRGFIRADRGSLLFRAA